MCCRFAVEDLDRDARAVRRNPRTPVVPSLVRDRPSNSLEIDHHEVSGDDRHAFGESLDVHQHPIVGEAVVGCGRVASDPHLASHALDERHTSTGHSTSRRIERHGEERRVDGVDQVACGDIASILAGHQDLLLSAARDRERQSPLPPS